ncbi:MAG TPA: electron transfer flavoprotein subunit alpha/FixB family protein [Nitrososphaerales archaeon]|nr:electron transfer flavoprotein subunit alpha/FixB family protein [Nitrososphaerales archaeon]
MSPKVWAFSEAAEVANEVAAAAKELSGAAGGSFTVLWLDADDPRLAGEDRLVLKAGSPLAGSPEASAEAIARAAKEVSPEVILVGATRNGKEVAARLAVKLGRPCISDVFGISLVNGSLRGRRNAFAAKIMAEVAAPLPCIATVKVGTYPSLPKSSANAAERLVGDVQTKTRVLERREKPKGTVDLKGAKLIVAAGRGVKKKEDLSLISSLASELGGAVGCSRPLSSDMGWLPEEHHIGLTGVSVHPDLYLAVGISGQLQHVAGIKDSKVIAAVNTDKSAPIFEAADYGVVGDLYSVLPAVAREIQSRRH